MPSILFECKSTPSYGYKGMRGGSAVTIYSNGAVVHQQFTVGCPELTETNTLFQCHKLASDIEALIDRYSDALEIIPPKLNNGTLDGSHDSFRFGAKRISAWSITKVNPKEIADESTGWPFKLCENAKHENFILEAYTEILDILRGYGITESLPLEAQSE